MSSNRVTVRKSPSSRHSVSQSFDVCGGGVVMAKIQNASRNENEWYWYGVRDVKGNTASEPRPFDVVKAEVVAKCKSAMEAL